MANEDRCETLSIARRYSVVRWAKEPDKIRSNSTRKVFCLYRSTCPQQAVQRPTGIRGVMHKSATDRQHSVGPYKCDINGIVVLPDSTNSTVEVCTIVFAEDPNLVRALMSSPKTQIWGNTKSETILRWAILWSGCTTKLSHTNVVEVRTSPGEGAQPFRSPFSEKVLHLCLDHSTRP